MSKSSTARLASRLMLLLALLLSAVPVPATALQNAVISPPQSALDKQVAEWKSVLSKSDPFALWKNAEPDIQALGPGTHSWLVLLSSQGKTVGYMVVHAATDGSFTLGEYGSGPSALFSETVLQRSLSENGLVTPGAAQSITTKKLYLHPFAAFWEVTIHSDTYFVDAKTGEIVPIDQLLFDTAVKKEPQSSSALKGISSVWLKDTFDPYERLPWLTGEQPFSAQDAKKVQSRIRSNLHLRYVSEPFGEIMLYALPVIGFQRWTGGRLDLALDMEGARFIPLDTLKSFGRFYR